MIVSISYAGRLGNHLFQYCAAYIFANKFGFKIISNTVENIFDLPILSGNYFEIPIIEVTDDNFLDLLESPYLNPAHYRFVGYFQLKGFVEKYENDIKKIQKLKL